MDHDRLYKELFGTFSQEFVDLLLPDVAAFLDGGVSLVPLDKEIFTDVTSGDRHEVDLLLRAKFRARTPTSSSTSRTSPRPRASSPRGCSATSPA